MMVMNSELKKKILEALSIGVVNSYMYQSDYVKLRSAIAAVEADPEPAQKLTFDQIEVCFPDGGDTNESGITVSAQWLHDFARNVESALGERDLKIVMVAQHGSQELKAELEEIAHELNQYCPAADEYKGKYIHKYWADKIRAAITKLTNLECGS